MLNILFPGAIILVCGLFFLSGYEEFFHYAPNASNMDVFHFFDFLRNVGTFETMLIICCAIPYATSFYVDYNSSFIRSIKVRTGENKYIASRVIVCGVSGGLAISLGMLLFILLLAFKYPLVNIDGGAYQSVLMRASSTPGAFEPLLISGNYFLYFLSNLYAIFLMGALWSSVGLLISTIIPNPFVALFSPYLLYFLQSIFIGKLPNQYNTSRIIKGMFNLGSVAYNVLYITLFTFVLILLIFILFGYFCKRRLRDELH